MRNYKHKKDKLVKEIINQYHYSRWVQERHKSIDQIPEPIQKIYYQLGTLAEFPATSTKEEKRQLTELKQIRKKLKRFYQKKECDYYEIFDTVSAFRYGRIFKRKGAKSHGGRFKYRFRD